MYPGNIITTFHATQQLKLMLGEISEGLAEDDHDDGRRLTECINTTFGVFEMPPCSLPSCQDPSKLCDGSNKYQHIAYLMQGG